MKPADLEFTIDALHHLGMTRTTTFVIGTPSRPAPIDHEIMACYPSSAAAPGRRRISYRRGIAISQHFGCTSEYRSSRVRDILRMVKKERMLRANSLTRYPHHLRHSAKMIWARMRLSFKAPFSSPGRYDSLTTTPELPPNSELSTSDNNIHK